MARGRKTAVMIRLTPLERQTLLAWQRATVISAGQVRRGRIILLVADGLPIAHVAATVRISRHHVYKWVQRFLREGLEGLATIPRTPRAGPARDATPAAAAPRYRGGQHVLHRSVP